jgi:hypothetical protein
MRKKSKGRQYAHERVLTETRDTLNQVSINWDMYKVDILAEAARIMLQYGSLEEFREAHTKENQQCGK